MLCITHARPPSGPGPRPSARTRVGRLCHCACLRPPLRLPGLPGALVTLVSPCLACPAPPAMTESDGPPANCGLGRAGTQQEPPRPFVRRGCSVGSTDLAEAATSQATTHSPSPRGRGRTVSRPRQAPRWPCVSTGSDRAAAAPVTLELLQSPSDVPLYRAVEQQGVSRSDTHRGCQHHDSEDLLELPFGELSESQSRLSGRSCIIRKQI